jgi:phosphoglucosamine mutase
MAQRLPVVSQSSSSSASLPTAPLFGTDGIRGRAGELLTAPLALQVGYAVGQVLQAQAKTTLSLVILGQDSRNSGDMLATALSAGLTSAGVDVWNLGLCPTPGVAYLTQASGAAGGVMVSASHNPPEDNGIKVFGADGAKLSLVLQQQVEAILRGQDADSGADLETIPAIWGKHYHRPELVNDYADALRKPLQHNGHLQGMRVVLDLAWGAATRLATDVFRSMGAEVIALHELPDGDRINVNCGSTHLRLLQRAVVESGADLGFAFDGDADRALAVDNQGRIVDGDYILYLWGQMLRQQQQLPSDLIVSTVMANLGFEKAWQNQGGKLIRTSVGDQYVHAAMVEQGAMLGGEQSGHLLCRHYSVSGDGLLTALHLAALVQRSAACLSTLVDQSFQTYPQLLQNVRVEDRDRRVNWQNCDPLVAEISRAEKILGDQGRILVRASGTEPVVRVMVEAIDADLAQYWTDTLTRSVQQHLANSV